MLVDREVHENAKVVFLLFGECIFSSLLNPSTGLSKENIYEVNEFQ